MMGGLAKTTQVLKFALRLMPVWGVILTGGLLAPAQAESLLDVFKLVQDNDPVFKSARHAFNAAQEKIPQARAGLLPQISATGANSRSHGFYNFANTPESEREVSTWNWALQLTQPLIRVQNWRALDQAEAQQALAQAQLAVAQQDMILRFAQAYFDVEVARQGIAVTEAQIRATEELAAQNKKGFTAGTNAITEVYEAQSRFELARAQKVAAETELTTKEAELEKLAGQLPTRLNPLRRDAKLPLPAPQDVQAWLEKARQDALQVQAQQAAVVVAEKEVAKNSAAHLPTLDLTASYGRNASTGSSSTPVDFSSSAQARQYGIQLNIPLYAGGGAQSKVRESLAQLEQARSDLEAARRTVGALVRQSFNGVLNAQAQVQALEAAIASSELAIKGNRAGVRLGTRINIDVLNAEQQLFAAQRDLIKARYDVLLQGFKLKAAAGALTEVDVAGADSLFR
jgi:outer membrane protein